MALFMETTVVSAQKTIGEITECLVRAGAVGIATEYRAGSVTGLTFVLRINDQEWPFKLPARVDPVFRLLNGRRTHGKFANTSKDREQAERVAWRQLYRWVQAQLALIDAGMVKVHEVFYPYLRCDDGRTVFEIAQEKQFKALPGPGSGTASTAENT